MVHIVIIVVMVYIHSPMQSLLKRGSGTLESFVPWLNL